eukprot:TRINITY_DN20969_c0_g1_i1.p1 TRINITY_DN20969_c0_g1~~TRINITY_DN20969_c0_g1_i1.p1  ORF type:complete len:443 (+),score=86.12 TRINITY_DN20969_c0_g1_i1:76-1404(+)
MSTHTDPVRCQRGKLEELMEGQLESMAKVQVVTKQKKKAIEPEILNEGRELDADNCHSEQIMMLCEQELENITDMTFCEAVLNEDACAFVSNWIDNGTLDYVETIDFSGARMPCTGLASILTSLSGIEDLELDVLKLDGCTKAEGSTFESIGEIGRSKTLRILSLADLWIDDVACLTLSQGVVNGGNLTVLTLDGNCIGEDGAAYLTEVMRGLSSLRRLEINHNRLCDGGASKLLNCLPLSEHLSHLGMGANGIHNLKTVTDDSLMTAGLRTLCMRDNHLNVPGSVELSRLLRNASGVTALYLSNNLIGSDGLCVILAALTESTNSIRCLDVSHNMIKHTGCIDVAQFVAEPTCKLLKLDLSGNPIGDEGLMVIDEALEVATSLRFLTLTDCEIEGNSYTVNTKSGSTVQIDIDTTENAEDDESSSDSSDTDDVSDVDEIDI